MGQRKSQNHHWITKSFINTFFSKDDILYDKNGKQSNSSKKMATRRINTLNEEFYENTGLSKEDLPEDFLEGCFSQVENKVFGVGEEKLYNILKKEIYDEQKNIDFVVLEKFILFLLFLKMKTPDELKRFICFTKRDELLKDPNTRDEDYLGVITSFEEDNNRYKNSGDKIFIMLSSFFDDKEREFSSQLYLYKISFLKTKSDFILPDTIFSNINCSHDYNDHDCCDTGLATNGTIMLFPFDKHTYIMFEVGKRKSFKDYNKKYPTIDSKNKSIETDDVLYDITFPIDFYLLDDKTTNYLNKLIAIQSKDFLSNRNPLDSNSINVQTKKIYKNDFIKLESNGATVFAVNHVVLALKNKNRLLKELKKNKQLTKTMIFSKESVESFKDLFVMNINNLNN
jgi:hypothetical protein